MINSDQWSYHIMIMKLPQGLKLANIVVTQASIRLKFIFKILSITEVFNLVSKFEIKLLKWKLVQIWLHLSFQVLPREKLSDNFLAMHHPKMLPGCDFLPMFIWRKPNLDIEALNGLSKYEIPWTTLINAMVLIRIILFIFI